MAGDRADPDTLAAAFAGSGYDAVVDFIAYGGPPVPALRPVREDEADLDLETGSQYDLGKRLGEAALRRGDPSVS